MGKRTLNLYVDDELIRIAKAKNMNLSKLFESVLRANLTDEETLFNEQIDKRIKDLEEELAKLKTKKQLLKSEEEGGIEYEIED